MKLFLFAAVMLTALPGYSKEYLVKYRNNSAYEALHQMAAQKSSGMQVLGHHAPGSYLKVDLDQKNEAVVLAQLVSNPDVEWVVPNFRLRSFSSAPIETQNLREQWGIAKIQAERAWQRAGNNGNRNVVVAVIDTGVDYNHESLRPNMVPGYDFRNNDADPMDETSRQNPGHGTHCAGMVGATGLVSGGIVGMSASVSMMPIRFLGADGSGDLDGGIRSIDFAIERGAHVISASWGATVAPAQAQALIEAVKRADDRGVIFVAAAANDGRNNDTTNVYPANAGFPNTISVAASNPSDAKPSWSNFGKAKVHVSAPGENIMSTLPQNRYGNLSGTSMATPLVSGLVAFLKAQDPSLTGAQIRALIQTTGARASIETACNCRIDAFGAVDHLMTKRPWLVPAAATVEENGTLQVAMMNGEGPFQFTSANPAVLTVDNNGMVRGVAQGTTTISVRDAKGQTVTSLDYHVGRPSSGGNNPGNPPPGGGSCPFDPQMCQIICGIQPDLPFCQQ